MSSRFAAHQLVDNDIPFPENAITVEGLSKAYHIYSRPQDRLRQSLASRLRSLFGLEPVSYGEEFWALRDVTFSIRKGETVGIIGANGSGKSTLLQLICGTGNATVGRIAVEGRLAALLELGSGFNPEYSGRENVLLNGQLLGLSLDQVKRLYDDIVSFSGIGDFIDQPVKTYSSGMFVRLAFSVAIHAEPDILIVDEALSVGDIAFQNKCIERIRQLMAAGATILFVSHDISTLQLICTRILWLDHGRLRADGDPVRVTQDYYVNVLGNKLPATAPHIQQQDTGLACFVEASPLQIPADGHYATGCEFVIRFRLQAIAQLPEHIFAVSIYRVDGDWLIGQTSLDQGVIWPSLPEGNCETGELNLSPLCLAPGEYRLALGAYSTDYASCLALTHAYLPFSVRSTRPVWGKMIHPSTWKIVT